MIEKRNLSLLNQIKTFQSFQLYPQNLYTHYSSSPEQQRANQNTFINSATGQKLVAVQQSLIQNISAASESWSRDLYMDTINELKALGYTPKQQ